MPTDEEVPKESTGAFVPMEKVGEFNMLSSEGETKSNLADALNERGQEVSNTVKFRSKFVAAGLGTAVGGAIMANPVVVAAGLGTAVGGGFNLALSKIEQFKVAKQAGAAQKESEEAYTQSRKIVSDELVRTGATEDEFEVIAVTDEQVKIARKEMKKMEKKIGE